MDFVGVQVIESPVSVTVMTVMTWVAFVVTEELVMVRPLIEVVGGHGIESSVVDPVVEIVLVIPVGQPLISPVGVKETASVSSVGLILGRP
jgi:hypothetical protein